MRLTQKQPTSKAHTKLQRQLACHAASATALPGPGPYGGQGISANSSSALLGLTSASLEPPQSPSWTFLKLQFSSSLENHRKLHSISFATILSQCLSFRCVCTPTYTHVHIHKHMYMCWPERRRQGCRKKAGPFPPASLIPQTRTMSWTISWRQEPATTQLSPKDAGPTHWNHRWPAVSWSLEQQPFFKNSAKYNLTWVGSKFFIPNTTM